MGRSTVVIEDGVKNCVSRRGRLFEAAGICSGVTARPCPTGGFRCTRGPDPLLRTTSLSFNHTNHVHRAEKNKCDQ